MIKEEHVILAIVLITAFIMIGVAFRELIYITDKDEKFLSILELFKKEDTDIQTNDSGMFVARRGKYRLVSYGYRVRLSYDFDDIYQTDNIRVCLKVIELATRRGRPDVDKKERERQNHFSSLYGEAELNKLKGGIVK